MTPKGQTTDERRRWRRHLCTRARKENVGVHVLFDPRSLPRVGLPRRWRDTSVLSPASPSVCLPLTEFRRTELLDIMGLAHLFNISIKLNGPYMCINGFLPYGNLIERRLYLNT